VDVVPPPVGGVIVVVGLGRQGSMREPSQTGAAEAGQHHPVGYIIDRGQASTSGLWHWTGGGLHGFAFPLQSGAWKG